MLKPSPLRYHVILVTDSRFWSSFTLAMFAVSAEARKWARERADDYVFPLVVLRT